MGLRKPFDRALFAENDLKARTAITAHLLAQPECWRVLPNENKYGVDLYVHSADIIQPDEMSYPVFAVECEIKRVWESGPILTVKGKQCDTVQLPERKRKYLDSAGCPVQYWILNATLTHAIVIPGELLLKHEPVIVRNKYVRYGEMFFQLPVSECTVVELERVRDTVEGKG